MTSTSVSRRSSRLALLVVAGLLTALFAAPGAAAAASGMTISAAELAMVNALNADRTTRGLVPVRIDTRLMEIANARSLDMATKHYFDHYVNGRFVFADMLNARKIAWYNIGEIIASNNYPTLERSLSSANSQWLNSPGHKAIVVSTAYNYIGVGVAFDRTTGNWIWTAVYIKGPDRTGATARAATPTVAPTATAGSKRVTVRWTGADVRLQVLTAGFKSFMVQRRVDGGPWTTVWSTTTVTSMSLVLRGGHTYGFRVAARDKANNWGAWSRARTVLP